MRLFSGKIPTIAQEVVTTLSAAEDIETAAPNEVALDIESVLKEYVRAERRVIDEAKTRMESRGMSYGELGRVKSQVAREMKIPIGEDTLPYLLDQILEMLFHSSHVEEVFADDAALRRRAPAMLCSCRSSAKRLSEPRSQDVLDLLAHPLDLDLHVDDRA